MYWFSAAGAAAYGDGHYAASEAQFTRLDVLDLVQPWRTHLGRGDARYRQGDLLGAAASFARALALAPHRCDIRFNLAVTLEAQGDALLRGERLTDAGPGPFDSAIVGLPPTADAYNRYLTALNTIDVGDCPAADAQDDKAPAIRLAEARTRILDKLAAASPDEPTRDDDRNQVEESADRDRSDDEQIDQLEERNGRGAAQREAGRDQNTTGGSPEGQSNW